MRNFRRYLTTGMSAAVPAVACGSSGGTVAPTSVATISLTPATPAPPTPAPPTPAPATEAPPSPTASATGAGGGKFPNGSLRYKVSSHGLVIGGGEVGFFPPPSKLNAGDGKAYLVFVFDDNYTNIVLTVELDGDTIVASYTTYGSSIPASPCTGKITRNDASGASGTFECKDAKAIFDGQQATGAIGGTFDAYK